MDTTELLKDAASRAAHYLDGLKHRPLEPSREAETEASHCSSLWVNQARPAARRFFVLSSVST